MVVDELTENKFPESSDWFELYDEDALHILENSGEGFGEEYREVYVGNILDDVELREPDNIVLGLSSLMNTALAKGMRMRMHTDEERLSDLRDELTDEYVDSKMYRENNETVLETGVPPSTLPSLVSYIDEFREDVDVYYPASLPEKLGGEFDNPERLEGYNSLIKKAECQFPRPETFLSVVANDFIDDLEKVSDELDMPDREDYNDRVMEAAEENLQGETALITQNKNLTYRLNGRDSVILQTPELARRFFLSSAIEHACGEEESKIGKDDRVSTGAF